MGLNEFVKQILGVDASTAAAAVVVIMTLVQIAPIKIDPWTWIGRAVGRVINGETLQALRDLRREVDELKRQQEIDRINEARRRILTFHRELVKGEKHSESEFDDIHDDMTVYNTYCNTHPDYPNDRTAAAQKNINRCYEKCLSDKDFI